MFIHQAPTATFACTFMKILFTSAATSNRTLMALIYIPLKSNLSQDYAVYLFLKTFLVSFICCVEGNILFFLFLKGMSDSEQATHSVENAYLKYTYCFFFQPCFHILFFFYSSKSFTPILLFSIMDLVLRIVLKFVARTGMFCSLTCSFVSVINPFPNNRF